ncbi:sensor histidine kinase [Larkinella terrae]|uniref:Histidine kinase n=1 Tax=Larkinella terrae TaxID=2025311 RepID=A0A7K0EU08_9BACT|nr:histidine kinase [Larkinella terrae]MRS65252.1 histidine kinase [Larkinella terrae]
MNTLPISTHLTNLQKWQLAASVFAIYWPIRIYVNWPIKLANSPNTFNWLILDRVWPLWLMEIAFTIFFFTLWLRVTEWIQQRFFNQMGKEFLVEFKLPAQLATLVIAGALAVLFNLVFNNLWITISGFLEQNFHYSQMSTWRFFIDKDCLEIDLERRRKVNNGLTVMAMLSLFYLAANRRGYKRLEDVRVNAELLKQEAIQAQFSALKNQVNPHFLFNSLSILSSLVETNTKMSVQYISRLSKVYRYILEQRNAERISLKSELEFVDSYLFLLNIRFADKLKVIIEIPEGDATRYGIAPLTLQLLIENAVKHNRMSSEKPLIVTIRKENENLVIRNGIQLRPQAEVSTGLGLQNIISRYKLLTPLPVLVEKQSGEFIVQIPLLP